VRKHCSNPRCFKEKNYEAKFSTNLILKKIEKDNFEKKNTKTKTKKNKKRQKKKKEIILILYIF